MDDLTSQLQDQLRFLEALFEIVNVTEEAETCRIAMAALTSTGSGLSFLQANPIRL